MAVTVLARLKVQDYDRWRRVFEEHAALRKTAGSLGTHIFRNSKDSGEVIVNFQWDSEENFGKFLTDPEAQKAMAESGMLGQPDFVFLEDVGRTAS